MAPRLLVLVFLTACGSLTPPGKEGTTTGVPTTATGVATGGGTGSGTGGGTGTGTGGGCSPVDEWDDTPHPEGTGDSCDSAVDALGLIRDGGGSGEIVGNLHVAGDVDWYEVRLQDQPGDITRGYEDFNLLITLTEGVADVQFVVVRGDCTATQDCDTEVGYDSYSFFNEDTMPDTYTGTFPADLRACGDPPLEECPDYTGSWFVGVSAIDGGEVCGLYRIEVSN